eukprot:scaffold1243_cov173-Ochromonas_danica.AAC.7
MESIASSDYSNLRDPEFQAVIIVEYDDGRLFPLTESIPKCLLPVANRPLLAYQLDMLLKSNIAETFIVIPAEYESHFSKFLRDYLRDRMTVDLVLVEEMMGSADGLRAVADRIRGDFFCLAADVISQYSLSELTTLHRLTASDMTMLLTPSKESNNSKDQEDDIGLEYIALCDDGRVLMKTSALELDGSVILSKALLHRSSSSTLRLRKDLLDMGVYLLSHWLLEYVVQNKHISSLRNDLLPYIINRQFQDRDYLLSHFPPLEHRKRPLSALEPWLVSAKPRALNIFEANSQATRSSEGERDGAEEDLLRCFSLVYEAGSEPSSPIIANRLTTIASYLALNKDLPLHTVTSRTPWTRVNNYLKKEMTILGENTEIADKTITVKQCSIGNNVKIGIKSKLNNCIIMDGVTIGENIICDRAIIENGCNLNECNVASGYKVVASTKVRGEAFSSLSQTSMI